MPFLRKVLGSCCDASAECEIGTIRVSVEDREQAGRTSRMRRRDHGDVVRASADVGRVGRQSSSSCQLPQREQALDVSASLPPARIACTRLCRGHVCTLTSALCFQGIWSCTRSEGSEVCERGLALRSRSKLGRPSFRRGARLASASRHRRARSNVHSRSQHPQNSQDGECICVVCSYMHVLVLLHAALPLRPGCQWCCWLATHADAATVRRPQAPKKG